jgi:hypothetical protein
VNKKKYKVTLKKEFAQRFTVIFSLAIIAISFAGMLIGLIGEDMHDVSTLFALGNGLQYSTILQIAGFALVIAFFAVLLFSDHLQTRIRFLFRDFLLLLVTLVTTSIFALIFNWFSSNDIRAWLSFIFCTIGCFTVSFALTLLKLKLEGKKYTKLLEGYKVRHSN